MEVTPRPMTRERRQELSSRIATPSGKNYSRASREEFSQARAEWHSTKTYDEAIELNRLFIQGERICTNYHCGPLDEESELLIPGLLTLHTFGILTHGSQPFKKEPEYIERGGGWWFQGQQRPYLQFLIPQNHRAEEYAVHKLCELLLEDPRIATFIVQPKEDLDNGCEPWATTMDEWHPVTGVRAALTVPELWAEEFDFSTSTGADASIFVHTGDDWNVPSINHARCLDVTVASQDWDEDLDLLKLVKDAAMEAGIHPEHT